VFRFGIIKDRPTKLFVGHIALIRIGNLPTGLLVCFIGIDLHLIANIDHDNGLGASFGQIHCNCIADPTAGAGDQSDFAFDIHLLLPLL